MRILFLCYFISAIFLINGEVWAETRPAVQIWGGLNGFYSIVFRLNRNNIAGENFSLVMAGECTNPDGTSYINTFDFGGADFPDLLVRSNGRVRSTANSVVAGTGHVGDLSINCRFTKARGSRSYSKATCDFVFDSPARGAEQLDSCVGGISFSNIKTSRGR